MAIPELTGLPKPYLSATQLKMYLRCSAQYYYRYVEQMKWPPKGAMTLGSATHKAIETNYRQKIESHTDLPTPYLQEVFAAAFEELIPKTEFSEGEKPAAMKDEGAKLVEVYHREIAPHIQPAVVEEKWTLPFANVPWNLSGIFDLIDVDDLIVDHKTTGRSPSSEGIADDIQLSTYALAHRALRGREEKGVRLDYMVRLKEPKVVTITATRTQKDIDRLLKIVGFVAAGIKEKRFYPNPEAQYGCSPKTCGFYDRCHKDF